MIYNQLIIYRRIDAVACAWYRNMEKGGTISSCVAVYLLKIYCALISMYFLAHKHS